MNTCTNWKTNYYVPSVVLVAQIFLKNEQEKEENVRDFSQTKLDSEINAPFLLNEQGGDPHFLFYTFNENNIRNN